MSEEFRTYDYFYKLVQKNPLETAENFKAAWKAEYKIHSDVACLMLGRMSLSTKGIFGELRSFPSQAYELKKSYEKPPAVETTIWWIPNTAANKLQKHPNFNMQLRGEDRKLSTRIAHDFEKGFKRQAPTHRVLAIQKAKPSSKEGKSKEGSSLSPLPRSWSLEEELPLYLKSSHKLNKKAESRLAILARLACKASTRRTLESINVDHMINANLYFCRSEIPVEPDSLGPPPELIPVRRSERTTRLNLNIEVEDDVVGDLEEPANYKAAMLDPDKVIWQGAMDEEMNSMKVNEVWIKVDPPPNAKVLRSKWLFKKKTNMDGEVHTYKARLVAKGCTQTYGIDYEETFSPVADIRAIRILIAIATYYDYEIWKMDVKTAFLNDRLDEDIYIEQPERYVNLKYPKRVCKLQRSIYGLKQASRQWNKRFDKERINHLKRDQDILVIKICVLERKKEERKLDMTKEFLSTRFSMKDMVEAGVILGIRIKYESNGIAIYQSHYIEKVLRKFNYFDCIPMSTPMDTMSKLSMYTSNLSTQHWQAIQRVLKYLKKTMDYSLKYTGYPSVLEGYTDASWISNTEDNSSTSGWVFLLGGALAAAGKEAEWLRNPIFEILLWSKPITPISILCDSATALAKAYSQMYNGKSRHLGVRHNMTCKLIMNGVVSIEFVRSQQNSANHLTKRLARDLVLKSAEGIGLKSNQVIEC
ncbi:zinc finger, CCHC-type containing protein [Tanacetum coccineum]